MRIKQKLSFWALVLATLPCALLAILGDDGEYESAPAILCRNCKKLLAVDTGN